jgi:hypothetical protein
MEILDKIEDQTEEPKYLRRSALLYKLCIGLFLFSISVTVFIKPLVKGYPDVLDLFIGLPAIAIIFISPVGLFFSWKSLRMKEGLAKSRFKYFIGHLIFCLLILGLIVTMISDF